MPHNLGKSVPKFVVLPWRSLAVSATTIAVSAMWFGHLNTTCVIRNATICSVGNLCVMKCSSFVDLLANEVKGVHCRSPKRMGFLVPVPSVVCVPVEITLWHIVLNGLDQFYLPLWFEILMLSDS